MSLPLAQTNIVDQNLKESVTVHPTVQNSRLRLTTSVRGPLLAPWASRERERQLRQYWHHDYNTLFRSAIAALIKRVQSTPWQVKAPAHYGDYWQRMLMQVDFGDWDRFVSKLVIDYSRHDQGAFIELIAPGDPREAPMTAITGMAILDSARCYPTGDPHYPVIYYDLNNEMHQLHRGRVVQFIDSPDPSEDTPGYGDCALSRAIAPVYRQILVGRYIQQSLDDDPPPGVAVFGNISNEQAEQAIETMHADRSRDAGGDWGKILRLYGLHAEEKPTVEFVSFTKPPDKFDFEQYTNLDAREIALAIGIDVMDIWGEVSGSGIGTGRQTEVLSQKSRGKGLGRLLKTIERTINRALPEDCEFSFTYEDPQEDMEQAQILQMTASAVQIVSSVLSPDEQRTLLANTIPAVHDVLVDESGNVRRLGDADPKAQAEEIKPDVYASTPAAATPAPAQTAEQQPAPQVVRKDFAETGAAFAQQFAATASSASGTSPAILRSVLRDQLWNAGMSAYEDGLRDGGTDPADAGAEELARRRRVVAEWNASQTGYIDNFVDAVLKAGISADEITRRADLWVSKSLRAIYFKGLDDADEQANYIWTLGATEKHCTTCLALNGQVHKMRDYVKAGLLPGSSALECEGYHCDCKLTRTDQRTRGTLPGSRPSLTDRLTNWVRGLFGR